MASLVEDPEAKAEQPGIGLYCTRDNLHLLRGGTEERDPVWTISGKYVQQAYGPDEAANVKYMGDFGEGQELLRLSKGTLTALCQWGLPEGYIGDDLFGTVYDFETDRWRRPISLEEQESADKDDKTEPNANLILILYDNFQPKKKIIEGIRGIALCNINKNRMKLLVLGAIRPTVQLRDKIFAKGGMLLKLVQYLGADRKYIELFALETVISLYYYFGWRFIDPANCEPGNPGEKAELQKYPGAVADLKALLKTNPTEENLTNALFAFRGWAAERAKKIRSGEAFDDDGMKIATQEARESGYRMILCKFDNPFNREQGGGKRFGRRQKAGTLINTNVGMDNPTVAEIIFNVDTTPFKTASYPKNTKTGKRKHYDVTSAAANKSKKQKLERKIWRRGNGGKRRTKKRALRKKHRGRKTKGKKKKNKKWCKSTKKWCKYTKKNNCKKGLWKKKTKLGRASRKWCKSTKKWCRVRKKACKKRR